MTLENEAKKYATEILEHVFVLDFLNTEMQDSSFEDELKKVIASAYIDGFLEGTKKYTNGPVARE